ncbi:MAG: hypothetical protein RLZZ505_2608 [Verrucomicrobiota bacterium]
MAFGRESAWGPGELASAEEVDVEVRDGLSAVRAVVDHHAESAFREAEFGGDLGGGEEEVPKGRLISGVRLADSRDGLVRHYQDVDGSLRGNVAEGEAMFIAVHHIGRDFRVADFLENRLHWGRNLA